MLYDLTEVWDIILTNIKQHDLNVEFNVYAP